MNTQYYSVALALLSIAPAVHSAEDQHNQWEYEWEDNFIVENKQKQTAVAMHTKNYVCLIPFKVDNDSEQFNPYCSAGDLHISGADGMFDFGNVHLRLHSTKQQFKSDLNKSGLYIIATNY